MAAALAALTASFLIGAFPTAYLIGLWFGKLDIRHHGSGNVGTTNAFRVLGKGPGVLVFVVDFLKGFLPALFLSRLVASGLGLPAVESALATGVAAMLGHIFNPFLGFRGGKGIATGSGVLAASHPVYYLLVMGLWIFIFILSRIVSLSSLAALAGLIAVAIYYREAWGVIGFFVAIFILLFWTHRDNVSRLFKGEERRLY